MANIYLISGPCGCGKSTLADAFANQLDRPAYLIHGDDFQAGFITPADAEGPSWPEILHFNWDCIIDVACKALSLDIDVVIDYVVEDELPRVQALADEFGASLYYIVLTASEDTLTSRLAQRGDAWLTERALFLKRKIDSMPENQGHLLDITGMTIEEEISRIMQGDFRI